MINTKILNKIILTQAHQVMAQNNSSLIGFLKKKSLFSASPDRNARRKSKSKEKIIASNTFMTPRNQHTEQYREQRSFKNYNSRSSKNLYKDSSTRNMQKYEAQSQMGGTMSLQPQSPIRYYNAKPKQEHKPIRRNFNFKNPEEKSINQPNKQIRRNFGESPTQNQSQKNKQPNVWSNLVNHANTFQSARLQSKQCLESMSMKLQTEISNINYKIDVFESKMTKLLNNQFNNLHTQILTIIDNVFAESQANIRAYIKQQEKDLAGQLLEMRQNLRIECDKVQIMKQQINKPHWRKVAGELLSTQLQEKVQIMVNKSKSMDIRHWEIGDLGSNKVRALEYQLKEIVTLTT